MVIHVPSCRLERSEFVLYRKRECVLFALCVKHLLIQCVCVVSGIRLLHVFSYDHPWHKHELIYQVMTSLLACGMYNLIVSFRCMFNTYHGICRFA